MKKQHLHGPVAMGACILCHDSHSSWKPKLLVAQGNDLCAICHEDKIRRDQQARHVHPPVTGECEKCHDPHSSDYPQQMREEDRKLCVSCHEDIGQLIAKEPRGPRRRDRETGVPELPRRTFLLAAHAPEEFSARHVPGLPQRGDTAAERQNVANMAALLKENPNHHGPIRQADCSACHNPHASPHPNLLTEAYPELFYAPFNPDDYKLCFTCHRSELVSAEDGQGLTEFRNGDLNLHYVHVSKPRKGRTCRACHAVHASKSPAHISEVVPYGNWKYEIKFEAKPNGGTCAPPVTRPGPTSGQPRSRRPEPAGKRSRRSELQETQSHGIWGIQYARPSKLPSHVGRS